MTEWLHFHFSLSCIGEGNGNPLQYPCLEKSRDGGAWWAAVYWVAQSWTRLKRLSSSSRHLLPVNPKGNQSWIFFGRTDAELKLQYFGHLMQRSGILGKTDTGKDWRQEEKGMAEDEMVGWHHQLDGHEFEQVPEVGDGQGSLASCSPRGYKELDTTERLNWNSVVINLPFRTALGVFRMFWYGMFPFLIAFVSRYFDFHLECFFDPLVVRNIWLISTYLYIFHFFSL